MNAAPRRPRTLAAAIERGDWQVAAHYLLIALLRVARELPAATLDGLIAALDDTPEDRDERRDR